MKLYFQIVSLSIQKKIQMLNVYQFMEAKNIIYKLLVLAFLFVYVCPQACLTNCAGCGNFISCSICNPGYTTVNNTYCAPCTQGCSACEVGQNGLPFCTSCIAPYQQGANGFCILCSQKCLTCSLTPTNCTSCKQDHLLTPQSNSSSICVPVGQIPYCIDWQYNTTYCLACIPTYYPYQGKCIKCEFPCLQCVLGIDGFFQTTISTYGDIIRQAYNNNFTGAPSFFNGGSFQQLPYKIKQKYLIAFSFIDYCKEIRIINNSMLIASIPGWATFLNSLGDMERSQVITAIITKFNNQTGVLPRFDPTKFQQLFRTIHFYKKGMCIIAKPGFYVQSIRNPVVCQKCNNSCSTCNLTACTSCVDGFYLDTGSCLPCFENCLACSNNSTCTKCKRPYTISAGRCQICNHPCETCSNTNSSYCLTCISPYALNALSGNCYRCNQGHCLYCFFTNRSLCLECAKSFTLVSGVCQPCPANCAVCSKQKCFTCLTGFSLQIQSNNSTICTSYCKSGCLNCDRVPQYTCLKCQKGFYIDSNTSNCMKCRQGCKQCLNYDICIQYQAGLTQFGDNFYACRLGCQYCNEFNLLTCRKCSPSFFLNSTSYQVCLPCSSGCKTCTSLTACLNCIQTFTLINGTCHKCQVSNCLLCSGNNLTQCAYCNWGFKLLDNTCTKDLSDDCYQLKPSDFNLCLHCRPGTALMQGGTCVRCLESCTGTCDPKNISRCLSCTYGHQLKNNKCVQCPPGCVTCANGQCSRCASRYRLSQDINTSAIICKPACPITCYDCTQFNHCTACRPNFTLVDGKCLPNPNCGNQCSYCPIGTEFYHVNQTCVNCPVNCGACIVGGSCTVCKDGYYLNNNTCIACPPKCLTCYDENRCKLCAKGYVNNILSMDFKSIQNVVFGQQCIACSSNCLACQTFPDFCTQCRTGYRKSLNKCIQSFQVSYTIEIDYDFNQFLNNSVLQFFTSQFLLVVGFQPDNHYIRVIRPGSTIIEGALTASTFAKANDARKKVGNPIPALNIISSSAVINQNGQTIPNDDANGSPSGGDTSTQPSTQNLPLIIGLSVGLGGAAIIAVGLFLLYKYKYSASSQLNAEETNAQIKVRPYNSDIEKAAEK